MSFPVDRCPSLTPLIGWGASRTNRTAGRRGLLVLSAVVVAAFGPYISGGLRTEQIAVYSTATLLLVFTGHLMRPDGRVALVLTVWCTYTLTAALGGLDTPLDRTRWVPGTAAAGLDNLVLPLAAITVVVGLMALGADQLRLLRRTAQLVVLGMMVNTFAAVAQYRGATWSRWWSAKTGQQSVADLAVTNDRFSGLINQPAEGGVLYGIALLCAIYLWSNKPGRLLVALTVLVLGGMLTVSKIFLLLALPIACWQIVRTQQGRTGRLAAVTILTAGFYVVVQAGLLPNWTGADQLRRIAPSNDQSLTQVFTGDRFGQGSTLKPVIDAVWGSEPWSGYGVGGLSIAYDNGWVEALVLAGVVGVVCYTVALCVLVSAWRRMPRSAERMLLGGILLLAAVGSLGLPVLTANRASTVFWLLTILLVYPQRRPASSPSERSRSCDERGERRGG